MSLNTPIVIQEGPRGLQFTPLKGISARRDDPNSFNESLLQELIDSTPCVLPIREYLPSTTALFSLGREVPVDLGANNGYIDNLLVTNDGYLVIVETKLYRNPEGIREVIAQTLQYGMAVGQMPMAELEARIKRGQSPALTTGENIRDCVLRQATERDRPGLPADDFDEALERHLRRGEILLLIVSDGIHVGVERVTHWLNEQGNSSPFKFGLVELKFYTHGTDRLVIPRTVLKTREVSRHVVVVDIRPTMEVATTAQVIDEYRNAGGGVSQESRPIKAASPAMTKSQLVQLIAPEELSAASLLLNAFEAYPFDFRGTPSTLQVGFTYPPEGGEFHPLAYLLKGGVWAYPLLALRRILGSELVLAFHQEVNQLGQFYRSDQVENSESTGCQVRYGQLQEVADQFAAVIDSYRSKATELMAKQGQSST